jgi:hypothetical protein
LSFHNSSSSFAFRYFFNVNGRARVYDTPIPLVIIRVAYFRQQRGRDHCYY